MLADGGYWSVPQIEGSRRRPPVIVHPDSSARAGPNPAGAAASTRDARNARHRSRPRALPAPTDIIEPIFGQTKVNRRPTLQTPRLAACRAEWQLSPRPTTSSSRRWLPRPADDGTGLRRRRRACSASPRRAVRQERRRRHQRAAAASATCHPPSPLIAAALARPTASTSRKIVDAQDAPRRRPVAPSTPGQPARASEPDDTGRRPVRPVFMQDEKGLIDVPLVTARARDAPAGALWTRPRRPVPCRDLCAADPSRPLLTDLRQLRRARRTRATTR